MRRNLVYLVLLAVAACDPAPPTEAPTPEDRGPNGKADLAGTCEESCGEMSPSGCWCDDSCVEFGDCCPDKSSVCDGPACAPGFTAVATTTDCIADASCYEVSGQGWCTGECPVGYELDLSEPGVATCVPSVGYICEDGFDAVATASDCLQDASCYEVLGIGWCTGECSGGWTLESTPSGFVCVPPLSTDCVDGFELVESDLDCIADAACYLSADGTSWCTGECTAGTSLDLSGEPECVPAADECIAGFDAVPTESDCMIDASCYELDAGSWCTGDCPPGTQLNLESVPVCE